MDAGQFSVKVAMFAENGKDLHLVEEQVLPGRAQRDESPSDEAIVAVLNSAVQACISSRRRLRLPLWRHSRVKGPFASTRSSPTRKRNSSWPTRLAAVKQIPFPLMRLSSHPFRSRRWGRTRTRAPSSWWP